MNPNSILSCLNTGRIKSTEINSPYTDGIALRGLRRNYPSENPHFTGSTVDEWEDVCQPSLKLSTCQTPTYIHNVATFRDEFKRFIIDDAEMMINFDLALLNTTVARRQVLKMI